MKVAILVLIILFSHVNGEATLKLINLVYRHGDRSPVVIFKTDPNKEDIWPQGLGWLSKTGMRQHHGLGQWLKHRYVDTGFLSHNYTRTEITIHSSDEDRCLMSAYCNLAGLYPPGPDQEFVDDLPWQPIPVHTRPGSEDNTLNLGETCPFYKQLYNETYNSPEVQKEEKENAEFYQWLANKTEMDYININNIWKVADVLFCEKTHNLTLAGWVTDAVYDKLRSLEDYQFTLMYKTTEMKRLKGGPLLGEWIDNMHDKIKADNPTQFKMFMYSAHDTTVAAMLSALDVYNGLSPPYAAMVIAELHRNANGTYYVKVFYKNGTDSDSLQPLTLPGCDIHCPLDQFVELTKPRVPVDWKKECGLGPKPNPSPDSQLATAWIVVIVLGALLVILLIMNITMFVKYKRDSPGYKLQRLNEKA